MVDTYDRIDLTGPWAGFGFQGDRFFSPEGHDFNPEELLWLSLTFNLAREWRLMMAEERAGRATRATRATDGCEVIHLRHILLRRKERRLSTMGGARFADPAKAVRATRRHSRYRRG